MSKMKALRAALALTLGGLSLFALACGPKPAAVSANDTAMVRRGNVTVTATASGNLAFSTQQDLAFEMGGTVASVSVNVSDTVKQDQVLATLDTQQWQDNVTAKRRALVQANLNLENAQVALDQAQNAYPWPDLTVLQGNVDKARNAVDYARYRQQQALTDEKATAEEKTRWTKMIAQAETDLAIAQDKLNRMLSGEDTDQVQAAKLQVELAQGRVNDAEKALSDAQTGSPVIKAPFAGLITKVNVAAGDGVKKGTVAVQLVDPARFQADVLMTERDVFNVKVGEDAFVQLTAMPAMNLPAKVTAIAPTATITQGVVNYKVTGDTVSPAGLREYTSPGTTVFGNSRGSNGDPTRPGRSAPSGPLGDRDRTDCAEERGACSAQPGD